jgi:hypothetical protein
MSRAFASFGEIKDESTDYNIFDQDCNLDIFEQIVNISEPVEKLVKKELLIFRRYQLDVKDIKCPLQWWQKHEAMFPTIGFLARQTLGIVGFQIETERIFSLAGILTNLRRCRLQTKNLEKLIFVNKIGLMILEYDVNLHLIY